jgi:hypothetical protein
VNSQKTRESIQQTREWARAEYETKTKGLLFTKDFQSRQEALMHDRLATLGERVMAWILRRSWGEYVLYAIGEDGEPAYQRDCARELRIDKRRVADAVDYNKRRGYLLDIPGKKLYPAISPILASPPPNCKKSGEYRTFLEQWKVTHSSDFQELEVARSTVKRITKVLLSEYKKSKKQVESEKASLLETAKTVPETGQRAAVSPFEADNLRHQGTPAQPPVDEGAGITAPEAADLLLKQIDTMQQAYPDSPFAKPRIDPNNAGDKGTVRRILHELGSRPDGNYDEQHIIGYLVHITAQFKGWGMGGMRKASRDPASPTGPKSLGLLVNWAQDYARIAGRGGYRHGAGA